MYISPDSSLLATPAILVVAEAAFETPILLNLSAPILSFIVAAFLCSNNNAVSFCLLIFAFNVTSSRATPFADSNILLTTEVSPEITVMGTSNDLYPKKLNTKTYDPELTDKEKLPSKSVSVPITVPLITTLAKESGSLFISLSNNFPIIIPFS